MENYIGGAPIAECDLTKSWGITPGGGCIRVPGALKVEAGQEVAINLGGGVFAGVVTDYKTEKTFRGGVQTRIDLADNRIKLHWDDVYCMFNVSEVRPDNPYTPGIDRQKRYKHILPDDWDAQVITWSNDPWSAKDIIGFILGADTVSYSWETEFHPIQDMPVYGIDANNGAKLSNLLQEITEHQGLVLTLTGPYRLAWARKGEGTMPVIPFDAETSGLGEAITTNDTSVRIIGDSNRYQDFPIEFEPDWNSKYEPFIFEPAWRQEVCSVFTLDGSTLSQNAAIASKMRSVTVREYAALKGIDWVDWGMWGEVGRMDIPVWEYLQGIVFKAYRVPYTYTINGIDLFSLTLVEGLLASVDYDPNTGKMSYHLPMEYYPDTKAFVIAQGQQLDFIDPRTQTAITMEQLASGAGAWSACNRFSLDTKNKVIIFDQPVFVPGGEDKSLFSFPNRSLDGMEQTNPLYNIAVPNANATFTAAKVRASLTFDAERYSKRYGNGVRKGPKYTRGLGYHALMEGGSFSQEVPYGDGKKADQKADEIAASSIHLMATYPSGEYIRRGVAGTELNGCIDRVTIHLEFNQGLSETVAFAKEAPAVNFDSERDLDRKIRMRDLFPGQLKLLEDVKRLNWIERITKGMSRNAPTNYSGLFDVLQTPVGSIDCSPVEVIDPNQSTWNAGQPVLLDSTGVPSPDGKVFAGVVISNNSKGSFKVATQGIVPVLVKGPFSTGDQIGINTGSGQTAQVNGAIGLGVANADYSGSATVLAPVRLGAGSGVDLLAPWEVYEGSQPGTLRVSSHSDLFTFLLHPAGDPSRKNEDGTPAPIGRPLLTVEGLSTPDPGVPDPANPGKTIPTPNYKDPGDFTPKLSSDLTGQIWLEGDYDKDNDEWSATILSGVPKDNGWTKFPAFIDVFTPDPPDPPAIPDPPYQTAFYFLIAEIVPVTDSTPGQIFTISVKVSDDKTESKQIKVVQYAKSHLYLSDILHKNVACKFPAPMF